MCGIETGETRLDLRVVRELALPVVACRPDDVAGVVVADAARLKGHQVFSSLRFTH